MPSRTIALSVSALTSRIAGYVTRKSGGVGGALGDGRPYPDIWSFDCNYSRLKANVRACFILSISSIGNFPDFRSKRVGGKEPIP